MNTRYYSVSYNFLAKGYWISMPDGQWPNAITDRGTTKHWPTKREAVFNCLNCRGGLTVEDAEARAAEIAALPDGTRFYADGRLVA